MEITLVTNLSVADENMVEHLKGVSAAGSASSKSVGAADAFCKVVSSANCVSEPCGLNKRC